MAPIDASWVGRLVDEEPPPTKVLIIDDDEEDVYLLKRLLRRSKKLGYQVFASPGLDEGAALAAAEGIDVLLVDFFLGIGISIDSRRPNHELLSLPFILLSGLDVPDLEQVAREAGAIGFLCKGRLTVEAVDELALRVLQAGAPPRGPATVAPDACVGRPD